MLLLILQILQLLSGLMLIMLVMVHSPKGEGLGGIGGAAQMFASNKEAEAGLNKFTSYVAGFFLVVSAITGLYGPFLAGK